MTKEIVLESLKKTIAESLAQLTDTDDKSYVLEGVSDFVLSCGMKILANAFLPNSPKAGDKGGL